MRGDDERLPTASTRVQMPPRWFARWSASPAVSPASVTLAPSQCELEACELRFTPRGVKLEAEAEADDTLDRALRMGAFVALLLVQYIMTRLIAQGGLPSDARRVWQGGDVAGACHLHRTCASSRLHSSLTLPRRGSRPGPFARGWRRAWLARAH